MTHDQIADLRIKAVAAARKWIEGYREVHRVMTPHADFDRMLAESTDKAGLMAKYIVAMEGQK